jgi:predicted RNA-binding protein with PIN domain
MRAVLSALLSAPFVVVLMLSCTPSSSARINVTQTALNVLTDVVDPAYAATRVGCDAAEQAALTLQGAGQISIAELDARIRDSRARCDRAIAVYEQMVELQTEARKALERAQHGDQPALEQAELLLEDIRHLWRENP